MIETIIEAHKYYVQGHDKFTVFQFLLEKLLKLTNSEYGFIGEILYKDEIPFLRTYAITNIAWTEELKKQHDKYKNIGWDFQNLDTLFGLVITENSVIISNDPKNDSRRGGKIKTPEGHPPLNSFAGIPFYHNKKIIGMVGIANKPKGYTLDYITSLNPFFDTCSTLISSYKIQDSQKQIEETNNIFMSQVSHDMRTPLNGIFGYCQLLEMSIDVDNDELHDYIVSIKNCSNRLLGLIDDILCITKTVVDVNIVEINLLDFLVEMEKMIAPMASKNNIKIINEINNDFNILVDRKIIGVVFSNLLTNAIKYNKNGGTVILRTNVIDSEYINIDIKDTGVGIEKDDLNKIFDPFYRGSITAHIEGNGIGLSIVKKYVSSINGDISVESDKDIGSTFSLKLKYNNNNNNNNNNNILYVEDDITNQKLVKAIMKINNIGLDISDTISEAIEKIQKNQYKFFLLDLNLPDGNGLDIIPYVENKEKIIILTADANINTKKKIHEHGINNILIKPFNIENLLSIIKD
jgi:CheY-like chemotaxis protein